MLEPKTETCEMLLIFGSDSPFGSSFLGGAGLDFGSLPDDSDDPDELELLEDEDELEAKALKVIESYLDQSVTKVRS